MIPSYPPAAASARPAHSRCAASAPAPSTATRTETDLEFERVVTPAIPAMLRASKAILGSEDLAWDAVQETLLRIWGTGWLSERPTAALVHLAVKSSLHQLRCIRRRRDHESKRGEELGEPCCEEDPLALLEDAELRRVLRESVQELTQEYRAVVQLHALEGESYHAIASRLDLPLGTVRSRLSRGRALLRERLQARIDAA